jgi:hypothetical protein
LLIIEKLFGYRVAILWLNARIAEKNLLNQQESWRIMFFALNHTNAIVVEKRLLLKKLSTNK